MRTFLELPKQAGLPAWLDGRHSLYLTEEGLSTGKATRAHWDLRLRQIAKGRATHRDVLQLEPTESELAQEEAEIAAGVAARERQQVAKQEAAQPAVKAETS